MAETTLDPALVGAVCTGVGAAVTALVVAANKWRKLTHDQATAGDARADRIADASIELLKHKLEQTEAEVKTNTVALMDCEKEHAAAKQRLNDLERRSQDCEERHEQAATFNVKLLARLERLEAPGPKSE